MLKIFRDIPNAFFRFRASLPCRHTEAARRIRELEQQLMLLKQECQGAKLQEREHIACRLHDEVVQQMVLIRLKLGSLRTSERMPERLSDNDKLAELGRLIAQATETTRALTHELGESLVASPLGMELRAIAQDLTRRSRISVVLRTPDEELCLLQPQRSAVYRTVREFCTNVQKHSKATRVSIESRIHEGRLWIDVQDNGQGLGESARRVWRPSPHGGFGLASAQAQLRALGGELQVRPRSGCGTHASLVLPLHANPGA